jgi:hypothetical protein
MARSGPPWVMIPSAVDKPSSWLYLWGKDDGVGL